MHLMNVLHVTVGITICNNRRYRLLFLRMDNVEIKFIAILRRNTKEVRQCVFSTLIGLPTFIIFILFFIFKKTFYFVFDKKFTDARAYFNVSIISIIRMPIYYKSIKINVLIIRPTRNSYLKIH